MDVLICGLVNGPLTVLNIVANVFFIFCMVRPLHGERIKQPLKFLLWSLICCTITYQVAASVHLYTKQITTNFKLRLAAYVVFYWCLTAGITASVWLKFFYYTQIVPAQRALFIWIKKNIKPIIYSICLCERLFYFGILVIDYIHITNRFSGDLSHNDTIYHDTVYSQTPSVYAIAHYVVMSQHILHVCVMVMSSGSTAFYLCRHMRRMSANGLPLTCPQLRSEVRVTVTGILHGVLYVICIGWTSYFFFSLHLPSFFLMPCINFTVVNFYMAGTTFSLGVGQSVFRKRAADLWLRGAAQFCKGQSREDDTEARTGGLGHS